jgi:hypothetical protein
MSLAGAIRARLAHLLVEDKLQRIEQVAQRVVELERERAEVLQHVPLWDRVIVFESTEDEARVHVLDLALEPRVRVLRELREELEIDLHQVGTEFPAFGVGVEVERCFALARSRLAADGTRGWVAKREKLCAALEDLAKRIVETWVADFDPAQLFERLGDEARCRREAQKAPSDSDWKDHPRLGVSPLSQDQLAPLVAQRLLAGDFFPTLAQLAKVRAERDELAAAVERVSGKIPFRERLNVFSQGRVQAQQSESLAKLSAAEESVRRCFEHTRGLLYKALGAYPPLAVHQRAAEALGLTSLLRAERASAFDREGRVREREVLAPRALVLVALRRLVESFHEAFPDVPLPLTVAAELSDPGARQRSPSELLTRSFFVALEGSWSMDLREEALEHAALSANLARRAEVARAAMSVKDRILFWSARPKSREQELEARRAWHAECAAGRWEQLQAAARATSETLAPLAARDLALRASAAMTELRTDAGESRTPRTCAVHGRPKVVGALQSIHRVLSRHYGLRGGRAELLAAALACSDVPEEPPAKPFEPMTYDELVGRLAARLAPTDMARLHAGLDAHAAELEAVRSKVSVGKVSALDKAHVLATTPDAAERDALQAELDPLDPGLREQLRAVNELLDQALEVYPPALLFFGLSAVVQRVEAVEAETRTLSVDVGGRAEPRYECLLRGQPAALGALRRWCATLLATYGDLPDVHGLLTAWALRGVRDHGWVG